MINDVYGIKSILYSRECVCVCLFRKGTRTHAPRRGKRICIGTMDVLK